MTLPRHTPYEGSSKPFTIGLGTLDTAHWIEREADPETYLLGLAHNHQAPVAFLRKASLQI